MLLNLPNINCNKRQIIYSILIWLKVINRLPLYSQQMNITISDRFKTEPGLNFIKVLRAAFTLADPKCAKKTVKLAVSFGAFGT